MERATGTEVYGCGSTQTTDITLNIQTTTGGNFSISLNVKNTVEHLKKLVSKKLKVSKDRICLLHRERQLMDGTLEENGLLDGSRVILLPSVETGLLSQRPENSVMQALESLNDTQVNDFLSGKSPLNLTMRLGDHMMLIQLQLSTLNSGSSSSSRTLRTSTPKTNSSVNTKFESRNSPSPQGIPEVKQAPNTCQTVDTLSSPVHNLKTNQKNTELELEKKDLEVIQNAIELYQSCNGVIPAMEIAHCIVNEGETGLQNEQSPIKSLSNLVSCPMESNASENDEAAPTNDVKGSLVNLLGQNKVISDNISTDTAFEKPCSSTSLTPDSSLSDEGDNFTDQSSFLAESTIDEYPMENLFNSAVDKGLFEDQDESMMDREISNLATTSHGQESTTGPLPSFQSINEPLKNKRFQYLLHKTSKFKHPIGQNKQKAFMQSVVNKHKKRMQIRQDNSSAQPSTSQTEPYIISPRKLFLQPSSVQTEDAATSTCDDVTSTSDDSPSEDVATSSPDETRAFKMPETPKKPQRSSPTPAVDTKALMEASKNLTQKLKKLSKEVLTNKIDLTRAAISEDSARSKIGPGAVIESMKHHGKGIYSGTFSGTLNPALQDRYGRPKRDISTIIHILNDLLCAAPPGFAQEGAQISCSTGALEESSGKCLGCSQPSCSYGQCDGHLPSTSTSTEKNCSCELKECQCFRLNPNVCPSCSGKTTCGEICKKCDTAKTLALENSKTKCKLEQLRLVMQQKKQRREERKMKPYPTPPKTIAQPEPTPPIQEEIETLA